MKKNLPILLLIAVSIFLALASSVLSYRNAVRAAEDFLMAEALGIASSLDSSLVKYGLRENPLPDIVRAGRWEGIAFLALYREDGLTLLHSNENLINRKIVDPDIRLAIESGSPVVRYRMLGTGEEVFSLHVPIHIKGSLMALRVALHTYPARALVREARFQLLSVMFVAAVLAAVTSLFFIATRKRQELERTLVEREKLSVIGEMASVLAHEIRNPLGSIKGFAQYLRERLASANPAPGDTAGRYLDIIISESKRIEALTGDLLAYARQEDLHVSSFDLKELVAEVAASVSLPQGISVHTDIRDVPPVSSDREKLRQILVNLIQNAVDSIEAEGSVRIVAEASGRSVTISIADSGAGMDEETRQRIFQPFFTTRAKGTGLGLAIVDRYVKSLGGKIDVESAPGTGSTFTVRIE